MTQAHRFEDFQLYLVYLAEQPILHTEETIGNVSKIKKMRIIHQGEAVLVPALSGNSFRGQLRDILADQMFALLTDNGQQVVTFNNNEVYGALYSGGALRDASQLAGLMREIAENTPMIRLMGAAFGNVMWPSKIAATHITPCVQEAQDIHQATIQSLSSELLLAQTNWPKARDILFNDGPLTRKDDRRDPLKQRFTDLGAIPETGPEDRQQMIYYVECIAPGTRLLQQIYTKYSLDRLELGCLFDALTKWLERPSIGGRSAAGYGQVQVAIQGEAARESIDWPSKWPKVIQDSIADYRQYIDHNRNNILNALQAEVRVRSV